MCIHPSSSFRGWNGKHPIPWDFFYSFNDISGKDLNWFWNSWFFSDGYIDMAIQSVQKSAGGFTVTINNIGGFPAPFDITLFNEDGTSENFHQSPAIWKLNQRKSTVNINQPGKLKLLFWNGRSLWMQTRQTAVSDSINKRYFFFIVDFHAWWDIHRMFVC